MKEIRIDDAAGSQRLDKFLQRYLPEAGASFLYKMLRKKNILLNGKKASGKEILVPGDVIRVYFSDETISKFMGKPENFGEVSSLRSAPAFAFWVVYEDSHVLLAAKPAGVLSQKAEAGDVSMVEMLREYLAGKGELDGERMRLYAPGVVNRLDRNTSGLVICAKTLQAAQELSALVRTRAVRKYYLALASGRMEGRQDVHAWLVKDRGANRVQVLSHPAEGAEEIETVCAPLAFGKDCTLLEVELVTGKTHQIRSHLSFIGHPLLGDVKYGDRAVNQQARKDLGLKRQFLHAQRLEFPETDGVLAGVSGRTFEAPLPDDLKKALRETGLEAYRNRKEKKS